MKSELGLFASHELTWIYRMVVGGIREQELVVCPPLGLGGHGIKRDAEYFFLLGCHQFWLGYLCSLHFDAIVPWNMVIELILLRIPRAASVAAFFSRMYFFEMLSNTQGQRYSSSLSYPEHNSQNSFQSCPSWSGCTHIPHQLVPSRIVLTKRACQISKFWCCRRYLLPAFTDFS